MNPIAQPVCLERSDVPRLCIRGRVARAVLEHVARQIPVRVELPDGSVFGHVAGEADPDAPVLQIVRPKHFFERLGHQPKIGFAEAYMAGDWQPGPGHDLAVVLTPFAARITAAVPRPLQRLRFLVEKRVPRSQRNTVRGSHANITAHYDLGNDLFAAFLDPTLSYSAALFDELRPLAEQSLEIAQLRKVDAILDLARVGEGSRVLEIGTGWGTLAIRAAQRGAYVTTLTLSREQAALAEQRVHAAEVSDRVEILLQDYREITGTYDAVVSVEMIEAVGDRYWPTYFSAIDRLLAPGGVAAMQAILMSHDRYLATRRSFSWVQKHIFPGGIIPSMHAIDTTTRAHTSLRITGTRHFGAHYAETLRRWRKLFSSRWPQIRKLGLDETFHRMWELYLAYSESGFASGYLDVAQIRLQRVGE